MKRVKRQPKVPGSKDLVSSSAGRFPVVIWQEIARFAVGSLRQWISLSHVNKTVHQAMQHPRVLSHCKIYLHNALHAQKLNVGVRRLSLAFAPLLDSTLAVTPHILDRLPNLQYLDLSSTNITTLQHLQALPNLLTLVLRQCSALRSLSELRRWPSLTHLDVQQSMPWRGSLEVICALPKLEWLSFNRCHLADEDMDQFVPCHTLTSLDLSFAELTNKGLSHLAMLPNLEVLILSHMSAITHVGPLSSLTKLRTLYLDGCTSLWDIAAIACLRQLTMLNMLKCVNVIDLAPLSGLTRLQSLVVGHSRIHDLTPLSSLHQLRSLGLNGCKHVSYLDALENLPLEYLDLTDCNPSLRAQALARGNVQGEAQNRNVFTFVRT